MGVVSSGLCVFVMAGMGMWRESRAEGASAPGHRIVLLAGKKSHGPGDHEYEEGLRIVQACLEALPETRGMSVDLITEGWPKEGDARLEDAATIVLFCDGSDRDAQAHPILAPGRLEVLERLMGRGVGLVAIHYAVFVPGEPAGRKFLEWLGGYFDYETGPGANRWYSKIQTATTRVEPGSLEHAVSRGLAPFDLREEYYYNLRFREQDPRVVPILKARLPGEAEAAVVAWALERPGGGRSFGYTGGHFHANWAVDGVRRMVLNGILWTAGLDVPPGGAGVAIPRRAIPAPALPGGAGGEMEGVYRALIVTGPQHPAHEWRSTTAEIAKALGHDKRARVAMTEFLEAIDHVKPGDFDVLILNTNDWERAGLDAGGRAHLLELVRGGMGLVVVHFANGGFRDWPEFRKLARRVWVDGTSGHDAQGPFRVKITAREHPIMKGLPDFDTVDELYFEQVGEEPIEVLAEAHSQVKGKSYPMAWTALEGKGRIVQTVLGHDARALASAGTGAIVRRGAAWAAGREPAGSEADPAAAGEVLVPGRFGRALDGRRGWFTGSPHAEYAGASLTVQCWAKLSDRSPFNILVAHAAKENPAHWELYTTAGSGRFAVFLPGVSPSVIEAPVDIVDDAWHDLAMVRMPSEVRLYVDGVEVKRQELIAPVAAGQPGPLAIGAYPPQGLRCAGLVDEVRISRGALAILPPGGGPRGVEATTVGLWHLDELREDRTPDDSGIGNALAREGRVDYGIPKARPTREGEADARAADGRLRARWIDRVEDASLLSVRADTEGRLFAGSREGLFVYLPDGRGGFGKREKLMRFPRDTWINDIAIRGDDLYLMTNAALYRVPGGRVERPLPAPERILWGWPVDMHVTLHGMAWDGDGSLVFTAGDPLLNHGDYANRPDHWGHWTIYCGAGGTPVAYTGQGGVFRCNADGTGLVVLARGTRGSFGMARSAHGDFFINDNDHESLAARYSPARLLHASGGVDFGWPRGWMAEKDPGRSDLLETMTASMGREVPVGLAYHDGTGLPGARYADCLLQAQWGQRKVMAYKLGRRGGSWRGKPEAFLECSGTARPVGVEVLPDGRVAVVISYMQANEWSPGYVADLVVVEPGEGEEATGGEEVVLPVDLPRLSVEELAELWVHPAWRLRSEAHQEGLRRGRDAMRRMSQAIAARSQGWGEREWDRVAGSWPWLERIEPRLNALVPERVRGLVAYRVGRVRASGSELGGRVAREVFEELAVDPDPAVALAALGVLAERPGRVSEGIIRGPALSTDTYVRQAATRLTGQQGSQAQLEGMLKDRDARVRLAGVLAVGVRLSVPPAVGLLPPSIGLEYRSENAVFKVEYFDQTVDLKSLSAVGSFTSADRWRLAPRSTEDEVLFARLAARLGDADERVRRQAAVELNWLNDPRVRDQVREVLGREPRVPEYQTGGPIPERLQGGGGEGLKLEMVMGRDWEREAARGNKERGRELFGANGIGCARCHAVEADVLVLGGPSLAGAAGRLTAQHVAESILDPSRVVAEEFRASRLAMKDGRILTGLVVAEGNDEIEVLLTDSSRLRVAKGEVEERRRETSSPMPGGLVSDEQELRDLLAFLLSK
jgi:putative heme-binding domain-containing protein